MRRWIVLLVLLTIPAVTHGDQPPVPTVSDALVCPGSVVVQPANGPEPTTPQVLWDTTDIAVVEAETEDGTPACPTVQVCAYICIIWPGPETELCAERSCTLVNTGLTACQLGSRVYSCVGGQTIHRRICDCKCPTMGDVCQPRAPTSLTCA